jgi:hypothetical protein
VRQLSLFSAGVQPPEVGDLDGLLVGPAHVVRRAGTARVSVLLPHPDRWRADALLAGLDALSLGGEVARSDLGTTVRTRFAAELAPLAARWTRGAATTAPANLVLDGARLRWWCLAAGYADPLGFVLVLGDDEATWGRAGSALAAAGVAATFVRPRLPGRLEHQAYRVVGARRLARLAELVGPAPRGAAGWPSAR